MGTYVYIQDPSKVHLRVGETTPTSKSITEYPLFCTRYSGEFYDNLFKDIPTTKRSKTYYDPHKIPIPLLNKWFLKLVKYGVLSRYPYQSEKTQRLAEAYFLIKDILKILKSNNVTSSYIWLFLA